jgi:EAL domain-containing protein (putative c-di-GMP-specific phosphodiesterase class I)
MQVHSCAIKSAVARNPDGLYFIPLSLAAIDDPPGTGLPATSLVFDIAENDLTGDTRQLLKFRQYLRTRGFSVALSGVGQDFANIRDFAPEYIRIDRRLVRAIDRPECGAAISRLARTAEASGARLIATGVDRVRMLESLWLLGIQFMQGDLFGRPSARMI